MYGLELNFTLLLYRQMSVCYYFKDADKGYETPGLEKKTSLLMTECIISIRSAVPFTSDPW